MSNFPLPEEVEEIFQPLEAQYGTPPSGQPLQPLFEQEQPLPSVHPNNVEQYKNRIYRSMQEWTRDMGFLTELRNTEQFDAPQRLPPDWQNPHIHSQEQMYSFFRALTPKAGRANTYKPCWDAMADPNLWALANDPAHIAQLLLVRKNALRLTPAAPRAIEEILYGLGAGGPTPVGQAVLAQFEQLAATNPDVAAFTQALHASPAQQTAPTPLPKQAPPTSIGTLTVENVRRAGREPARRIAAAIAASGAPAAPSPVGAPPAVAPGAEPLVFVQYQPPVQAPTPAAPAAPPIAAPLPPSPKQLAPPSPSLAPIVPAPTGPTPMQLAEVAEEASEAAAQASEHAEELSNEAEIVLQQPNATPAQQQAAVVAADTAQQQAAELRDVADVRARAAAAAEQPEAPLQALYSDRLPQVLDTDDLMYDDATVAQVEAVYRSLQQAQEIYAALPPEEQQRVDGLIRDRNYRAMLQSFENGGIAPIDFMLLVAYQKVRRWLRSQQQAASRQNAAVAAAWDTVRDEVLPEVALTMESNFVALYVYIYDLLTTLRQSNPLAQLSRAESDRLVRAFPRVHQYLGYTTEVIEEGLDATAGILEQIQAEKEEAIPALFGTEARGGRVGRTPRPALELEPWAGAIPGLPGIAARAAAFAPQQAFPGLQPQPPALQLPPPALGPKQGGALVSPQRRQSARIREQLGTTPKGTVG